MENKNKNSLLREGTTYLEYNSKKTKRTMVIVVVLTVVAAICSSILFLISKKIQ